MKRTAAATVGLLALLAAPAIAADLPVKAPVSAPVAAPVWNWTGFYIGASGGGTWGRAEITHSVIPAPAGQALPEDAAAVTAASSPLLNPNGIVAGGHAGFNYQTGSFVWGLEGDFSYFRLRANSAGTFPFPSTLPGGLLGPPTLTFTANTSFETDWLFTFRPRAEPAIGPGHRQSAQRQAEKQPGRGKPQPRCRIQRPEKCRAGRADSQGHRQQGQHEPDAGPREKLGHDSSCGTSSR